MNITDDEISIEPVGIKLLGRQKADSKAVLESDDHELFCADFSFRKDCFNIDLARPNCLESIQFEVELVPSAELAEVV